VFGDENDEEDHPQRGIPTDDRTVLVNEVWAGPISCSATPPPRASKYR
jgi:hypothetical protein